MTKLLGIFVIAAGIGAGAAYAAEPVTVIGSTLPTARISYADLNLANDRGVQSLQRRVRSAASNICLEPTKDALGVSMARSKCFDTAVGDGFAQIDRIAADHRAGKSSLASAIVISAR